MRDASVFWLETTEKEIHFIYAIASAYDGQANVRRDYRLENGKVYFKVYVALGMEEEFLELIDDLRRTARIGEVLKDDEPLPAA